MIRVAKQKQGLIAELAQLKSYAIKGAVVHLVCRSIIENGGISPSARAITLDKQLKEEARALVNVRGRSGEDKVCAMFDYLINLDSPIKGLHPDVISVKKEFQLRCGRVDRLLGHADGSFTVVEIKPSGSRRDQSHGLGQAIMYAASMRSELQSNVEIRAALVVGADYDREIADACKSVGVDYIYISKFERDLIDDLAEIQFLGSFSPV